MKFSTIAVLGSGLMGMGIVSSVAVRGVKCIMFSKTIDASKRLNVYLDRKLEKGWFSCEEKKHIQENIEVCTYDQLEKINSCDLIIECTYEDKNYKTELIKNIDKFKNANAVFCTNTSTLSVTDLSAFYSDPSRFAGMHFFSPVEKMQLIEVVKGLLTSCEVIDSLITFGKEIGKEPVYVEDTAGFVLNRLIAPYICEAVELLEKKVSSPEVIDSLIKHCVGASIGPLQLADYIGLDVIKKSSDILFDAYKDQIYVSPFLNKKYYANQLGKKTRKGFYNYG